MLGKVKNILNSILDYVLPLRNDFVIVKNLTEESIFKLPKAERVKENDWINPLFNYKDRKVKAIIWELKYKENILPLDTTGKMLFEEMVPIISDTTLFNVNAEFLLIPIPMTDLARAQRGYNQSELLARSIIGNDPQRILIYAPQWFRKVKETPKQSLSESKIERMRNLENCFEANPNVNGKYVFLVDDVVTTGSTLKEARKTLLDTGAVEVFAFTIAH